MAAPAKPRSLDHIREGYAYHDTEARKLYDVKDSTSAQATYFTKCVSYNVGVFTIKGCLDLSASTLSVSVQLLGVTLASCQLTPANQSCRIGGSIGGFKAEVDLTFEANPPALDIDGQFCAPNVGCETFKTRLPL